MKRVGLSYRLGAITVLVGCGVYWTSIEDLVRLEVRTVSASECACQGNVRWVLRNVGDKGYTAKLYRIIQVGSSGGPADTTMVQRYVGGESSAPLECRVQPAPACTDTLTYAFVPPAEVTATSLSSATESFNECVEACLTGAGECAHLSGFNPSVRALAMIYSAARESPGQQLHTDSLMKAYGVQTNLCQRERVTSLQDTIIGGVTGIGFVNRGPDGGVCSVPVDSLPPKIFLEVPALLFGFDQGVRVSEFGGTAIPMTFPDESHAPGFGVDWDGEASRYPLATIEALASRIRAVGVVKPSGSLREVLVIETSTGCLDAPYR